MSHLKTSPPLSTGKPRPADKKGKWKLKKETYHLNQRLGRIIKEGQKKQVKLQKTL